MSKKLFTIILTYLFAAICNAQDLYNFKNTIATQFHIGKITDMKIYGFHEFYLPNKSRFSIAPTADFHILFGKQLRYVSSAKYLYYSDNNIDTFNLDQTSQYAINVGLQLKYWITDDFGIGIKTDIFGSSAGDGRGGDYIPGYEAKLQGKKTLPDKLARPYSTNVFGFSKNGRGTFGSELFADYIYLGIIHLRAALSFLQSEYRTTEVLGISSNQRFRYTSTSFAFGFGFRF